MAQGYYSAVGRTWDGSSWTTKSTVPQHNYSTSAVGTYNDASFLGGIAVSSGPGNVHLNWNGSSWSARTVMPVVNHLMVHLPLVFGFKLPLQLH